jgi:hypothetical protein
MAVCVEMCADDGLPQPECLLTEDSRNRYHWLINCTPVTDNYYFPGGMVAYSLFKASRYCFVNGHFLASIVLGLSYIENTLYGFFIDSDRVGSFEKGLSVLSKKAHMVGMIKDDEFDVINHSRILRNNFPPFNNGNNIPSLDDDKQMRMKVQEEDARKLMDIMVQLVKLNPAST